MLEAEFYPEDISEFRFSVRTPPSRGQNEIGADLAIAILNLLRLFMYPNAN